MNLSKLTNKAKKLPDSPGVYVFTGEKGKILYIGKAASLKSRVRSYFGKSLNYERPIEFVIDQIFDFKIKKTDTVIEAYFLEQELIKKHQPKYNVLGKDDKSFVYICLTKEEFPMFVVRRKTDLEKEKDLYKKVYGPYAAKHLADKALRILRKIFPYHNKKQKTEKGCLDYQIGLCPGPYDSAISKKDYMKNIKGVEMMIKGKKKMLIKSMEKEMSILAKENKFEKAAEKRNQLFSLKHIQDIALLGDKENEAVHFDDDSFRAEGYDISNISGKFCVGSMIVFDNLSGEFSPNKSQYRKFKIKTVKGVDDVAAMKEILLRRFGNDWPMPNMIFIDGGVGHLNMAKKVLAELGLRIPIIAVAKGPKRDKIDLHFSSSRLSRDVKRVSNNDKIISQIRDEAHRFAINFHRKSRSKNMLS